MSEWNSRAEILLNGGVRAGESPRAKRRGRLEDRFQTTGTQERSVQITQGLLYSQIIWVFCNELWFPLRLVYSSSWQQVIARWAERQELKGYQKKWKVLCPLAFSWGPGAGREQAGGNEMSLAASVPRVTQQL